MASSWRVAALFVAVSLSTSAFAQTSFTSVRGTIRDPSGAFVSGASVQVTNQANGQVQTQKCNQQGEYQFQQLAPGTNNVATSNTLGSYSSTLTIPRVQQFSLRYSF